MLKSGIPASRAAKGFSAGSHHLHPYPVLCYNPPSPNPLPQVIWKPEEHEKRKLQKKSRGMGTDICRAACEGDIQTQKEGRYLLYNMLHGLFNRLEGTFFTPAILRVI